MSNSNSNGEQPTPIEECEELYVTASMIEEIDNPTNDEILDAALSFYDSAQCFDNNGDRRRSAKCYTLAGEFYLAIEDTNKAAECYGKAILRNLMINDTESAKVILDKGEDYGDIFDTFHFRMAKEAFSRQTDETEGIDSELKELQDSDSLFDKESLDYELELPDTDLDRMFSLNLEEIDLDLTENDFFEIKDKVESSSIVSSFKGFIITEDTLTSSTSAESYNEILAYNILKKTRSRKGVKITSTGVGKGISGFVKDLESETTIIRKDNLNIDTLSDLEITQDLENQVVNSVDDFSSKIDDSLTLDNEFISISEVIAKEDDLEDIELQDSIPYSWQVKDIDTGGFELLSQDVDKETGSLVFTWRRNKLIRGEKARIKYLLRRRLQRSIVMVSKKQIYVMESFHSILEEKNSSTISIEFKNPYHEDLEHVLIEDIIPDEVKIVNKSTSREKDSSLQIYSTKEGLIYRYIFTGVSSKESINFNYSVTDRPFTRWFEQNYNLKGIRALKVEKIAEPLIEFEDYQYILFFELQPDQLMDLEELELKDEIPLDADLISTYPLWFRPTIEVNENNEKFLIWPKIALEGKTRRICLRLRVKNQYNPQEPIITFSKLNYEPKSLVRKEDKAEGVLDLRKRMGLALMQKD